MGTTTMGVKLDDATRERIKTAASRIDRTPHWLIKQAILIISKDWKMTTRFLNYRPCWQVLRMRAMSRPRCKMKRISLSGIC